MELKKTTIILPLILICFVAIYGCTHKVNVGTKKPIAVDVNMRVDVYHHVQKKANYIEDIVSGEKSIPGKSESNNIENSNENNSSSLLSPKLAYAQQINPKKLTPEIVKAIKSRRNRYDKIRKWESKGVLMEDSNGYIKINGSALDSYRPQEKKKIQNYVKNENKDRKIIYKEIAKQHGISIKEVGRQFSYTHKKKAPKGTWIQVKDTDTGNWVWKQK